MPKFTVDDLKRIKEEGASRTAFEDKTYLLICGGTGCHATGSIKVMDVLQKELDDRKLSESVEIVETGCMQSVQYLYIQHAQKIFTTSK